MKTLVPSDAPIITLFILFSILSNLFIFEIGGRSIVFSIVYMVLSHLIGTFHWRVVKNFWQRFSRGLLGNLTEV